MRFSTKWFHMQMVSTPGELLCVLERWHTCYWLKHYLLQQDLKGCMATSHFISIQWSNLEGESLETDLYGTSFSYVMGL